MIELPPQRVDCHYMITAWSGATAASGIDPTIEEHKMLSRVRFELWPRAIDFDEPYKEHLLRADLSVLAVVLAADVDPRREHAKLGVTLEDVPV